MSKRNVNSNEEITSSDGNSNGQSETGNSSIKTRKSYNYLTPKAVDSLPKYVYQGCDKSIIYKHLLSPLALFLVENFTPRSIAPNTITLLGLVFMITAYNIVWYHCPTLQECSPDNFETSNIPEWIFCFNGMAMLIYQTLDNMDGKQARRTGSSSPLGLLFDHGIDAINILFGSANWICAMGLSPILSSHRWQIYAVTFCPMIEFFISTWDQYHTGKLILPIFNGATEGLLLGASLSFTTYWYGREFWHGTQFYDTLLLSWIPSSLGDYLPEAVVNYNIVMCATVFATIRENLDRIIHVVRQHSIRSIESLIPIVILSIGSVPIIHSDLFPRNPRTCLHLLVTLFADMTISLMLDHCCQMRFNPYRPLLAPFVMLSMCVYANVGMADQTRIDQILLAYTVGSLIYLCAKIRLIIHEVCAVLKIWCFDIETPYSNMDKKE